MPSFSPRAEGLPELYSWLISDRSPPVGLSAWAFRHEQDSEVHEVSLPVQRLELPIVVADGRIIPFFSMDLTLKLVNVTLVYHPGWRLHHSPAASGIVTQIWPVPYGIQLFCLPTLQARPA
jgi:hypothetical protein